MTTRAITSRLRDDQGFTLTEMLVVTLLMTMVIGLMFLVFTAVNSWSNKVEARGVAAREARITVDRMARDMRQATEISSGEGAFLTARDRECEFYADIDHDNIPELVSYRVEDNRRINRTVRRSLTPVYPYEFSDEAEQVTTLIGRLEDGWKDDVFSYLDSDENVTWEGSAVSAVDIHFRNEGISGPAVAVVDTRTLVKVRSTHGVISLEPIGGNCHG